MLSDLHKLSIHGPYSENSDKEVASFKTNGKANDIL